MAHAIWSVGLRPGSYVEYGVIDAKGLQPRPDGRPQPDKLIRRHSPPEAGLLPLDYAPVAYHTLKSRPEAYKREKIVLIHAAAGGTGVLAVQLAKYFWCTSNRNSWQRSKTGN